MAANITRVKKRSLVLLIAYSIIIITLILRVGYYQIVKGEEYSKKAYLNQTLNRVINPKRGTIYDRNGKDLAISASVDTISVNPQDFRDKMKDTPELV
ncbi:MAG: peptidoglycan glycosyltransferase, partial [Ruminiclostridium sp.]|nr:peptidoglycan glycosyltransferase [Ruminiclostridium sp.]